MIERRRKVMNDWAAFLVAGEGATATVMPFKAQRPSAATASDACRSSTTARASRRNRRRLTAAKASMLVILTAARSGGVFGMRRDEVQFAAKLWTVRGERMKMGVEHVVPLSDAAAATLREEEATRRRHRKKGRLRSGTLTLRTCRTDGSRACLRGHHDHCRSLWRLDCRCWIEVNSQE
jgi:integrase